MLAICHSSSSLTACGTGAESLTAAGGICGRANRVRAHVRETGGLRGGSSGGGAGRRGGGLGCASGDEPLTDLGGGRQLL